MVSKTLKVADDMKVDIGLQSEKRVAVAKKLAKYLASHYTLFQKTLYYHWNVTGKQFVSLHELFEKQYRDLFEKGDELAERIRALGHMSPGTFREFMKLSSIEEDQELPGDAETMVENLLYDHEQASQEARAVLKIAEENKDEVTVDMMIERMTFHDETAWMLRSILE